MTNVVLMASATINLATWTPSTMPTTSASAKLGGVADDWVVHESPLSSASGHYSDMAQYRIRAAVSMSSRDTDGQLSDTDAPLQRSELAKSARIGEAAARS